MKPTDFEEFQDLMLGMFETYGQEVSSVRLSIYKEALKPYEINHIRGALNTLIRRSKFIPRPADIIGLIDSVSGNKHLSPSEAWAMALSAIDESNTVIWTDEMHKAWVVAESVMRLGDEVGARRAFIESYERLVDSSINLNKPINVTVSLGYDKSKREEIINHAVFVGLIPKDKSNNYLPKPENSLSMLEFKGNKPRSSNALKHIDNIKKMINGFKSRDSQQA